MKLIQSLLLCLLLCRVSAELRRQLKYYETLSHVDVRVRKRRSVGGGDHGTGTKDISFAALGREFNLVLTPGSPVLAAGFQAHLVNGDGSSAPLYISQNNFYTGHLSEDEDVKTDALAEEGLWTANIYDKNDTYTLEPSWRHLPRSDNHSMIVYKHSDILWDNIFPDLKKTPGQRKKICHSLHADVDEEDDIALEESDDVDEKEGEDDEQTEEKPLKRVRRATPLNTCHIIAVADVTFFNGPGGGSTHRTANYIIQTIQRVNRLYQRTVWDSKLGFVNMGLQIKDLRIHHEVTGPGSYHRNSLHYNMNRTNWKDLDLLKQFGYDPALDKHCLAHLFTHRRFADGVLGLAYIASPRKHALGGICSRRASRVRAMNTGFSSTMNTRGGNLLTQEATLVTAHEFGHNWGAEHDAETDECAPDTFNNGKYVMYPYAVSGYDENNEYFSPCSKRYISAVLSTRSSSCFKTRETAKDQFTTNVPMCGNGVIDKGEECDEGFVGLQGGSSCCTKNCTLVGDAQCSSVNFECCQDCKVAPYGTPCRGESQQTCREAAHCSGFSLDCPASKALPPDTPCIDEGSCINGTCVDFCRVRNMMSCICDDDKSMCFRCCKKPGGACQVTGGAL
ncbi:ADAM 17-like protease, partial [Aplysia californica]|uniref:ADAM 17-like protease n=1 Tax=Aplysia californica TaxID=6500 RepID=A0ABM1W2X5_APLCA